MCHHSPCCHGYVISPARVQPERPHPSAEALGHGSARQHCFPTSLSCQLDTYDHAVITTIITSTITVFISITTITVTTIPVTTICATITVTTITITTITTIAVTTIIATIIVTTITATITVTTITHLAHIVASELSRRPTTRTHPCSRSSDDFVLPTAALAEVATSTHIENANT
ncbi:Radial Spoke Head Protein 6 A [Manis pentadactyla]|nr:Radial Spoke Head Protein 6 A [Manis pentadactyla]